ncbi:MAG: hypothetical protein HY914_16495 [Desulfomonile tiedjei]|nr:hypothetical protein [Desulfomonile tiedjei]
MSLTLGVVYIIGSLQASFGASRASRPQLALYLSTGVALTALGLLGLVGFLSPTMVQASLFAVIGMAMIVDAVSRMHAPPVGKTRWWFVAAGGVVSVLAGVFHGLAAYRY